MIFEHNGKCVGTAHSDYRLCKCVDGTHFVFFVIIIYEFDKDFGIGL